MPEPTRNGTITPFPRNPNFQQATPL